MEEHQIICPSDCEYLNADGKYLFCEKFKSILQKENGKIIKCHPCWKLELPIKKFYNSGGYPRCHYSLYTRAFYHFEGVTSYFSRPGKCQTLCPFWQGDGNDGESFFVECSNPKNQEAGDE